MLLVQMKRGHTTATLLLMHASHALELRLLVTVWSKKMRVLFHLSFIQKVFFRFCFGTIKSGQCSNESVSKRDGTSVGTRKKRKNGKSLSIHMHTKPQINKQAQKVQTNKQTNKGWGRLPDKAFVYYAFLTTEGRQHCQLLKERENSI